MCRAKSHNKTMAGIASAGSGPPSDVIKSIMGYLNKMLKPKDESRRIDGMKVRFLEHFVGQVRQAAPTMFPAL